MTVQGIQLRLIGAGHDLLIRKYSRKATSCFCFCFLFLTVDSL